MATFIMTVALLFSARVASRGVSVHRETTLGTFSWETTTHLFAFGDSKGSRLALVLEAARRRYSTSSWKSSKGILSADDGKTTAGGPSESNIGPAFTNA
ncbi:hypothetical protein P7C70_g354, partial [Phenoliferia sp. Uapishka_3]